MTDALTELPPTAEAPPPPAKKRGRMTGRRWIALVAAVVLVAVAGAGAWLLLRPQSSAQAQARTMTAQVEKSTQTVSVGISGTLSPQTQADLSFPVAGTVTHVYVAAGDTVEKGQKLARVDDDDLQDALELAEANLDTAEANLDDVEDDGSSAAIAAAEKQVESAEAAVASAEDDLDNAVLRSTIAGTVASVDLSVGDTVSASSGSSGSSGASGMGSTSSSSSSAQVVVISTAAWKLDGTVGSADLATLKAGQAASITPDGATEPIEGSVSSIGIVASSSSDGSATFPVVVTLDGEHPELYSGTTAAATIVVGEYTDVLTVPTAAITTADGKSVVAKVDGSATTQTEVTVGRVFGNATEITAGLAEGDSVQISFGFRQQTSDASSEEENGGLLGGGLGGGFGGGGFSGGGAPPAGGGAPPAGGNGGAPR